MEEAGVVDSLRAFRLRDPLARRLRDAGEGETGMMIGLSRRRPVDLLVEDGSNFVGVECIVAWVSL